MGLSTDGPDSSLIELTPVALSNLTIEPEIGATQISIPQISEWPASVAPSKHLRLSDEEERQVIFRALEKNLWIQKDAAKELGLSPRALNYRIQKHGITHDRWRKNK